METSETIELLTPSESVFLVTAILHCTGVVKQAARLHPDDKLLEEDLRHLERLFDKVRILRTDPNMRLARVFSAPSRERLTIDETGIADIVISTITETAIRAEIARKIKQLF